MSLIRGKYIRCCRYVRTRVTGLRVRNLAESYSLHDYILLVDSQARMGEICVEAISYKIACSWNLVSLVRTKHIWCCRNVRTRVTDLWVRNQAKTYSVHDYIPLVD